MSFDVNPTTIGNVGLGAQAAGGAMQLVGSYYGAKSQQSALNYEAAIAELNAAQSEKSAQQELMRGNEAVAQSTLRAGQVKSSQRAAMAANGVDLGQGSAVDILTSTDVAKEQDANTIAANAVRSAWGYRTQATNQLNQADMARTSAKSISPGMAATSSLLGSATTLASSYYNMSKVGVTSSGGGVKAQSPGNGGRGK